MPVKARQSINRFVSEPVVPMSSLDSPEPVEILRWSFSISHAMDMTSFLFLLLLAALVWFWFDSLRALEVARNRGKQACSDANVQFLDDTVANTALALARDTSGRRVLRRTYRFEFSETGNSRLEGQLILLGDKIESVTMEPYRIAP